MSLLSSFIQSWTRKRLKQAIQQSGLFDPSFYMRKYKDVPAGTDPLDHFLDCSESEVRDPSPGFCSQNYLHRYNDVAKNGMIPFVHYVRYGAREGRPVSPAWPLVGAIEPPPLHKSDAELIRDHPDLFDEVFYRKVNRDVAEAKLDPIQHYLDYGAAEGRPASMNFHTSHYCQTYPDVLGCGLNPLVQFIRFGKGEGRRPNPLNQMVTPYHAPPPLRDTIWTDWTGPRRGAQAGARVDVIVPVYGQTNFVLNCIYSVLMSEQQVPYELVVIDDCGPDPELAPRLRELASMRLITLIENGKNLGFVGSVNRGMAVHPDRDVVLLNSDTLVFNDWLDRLVASAKALKKAGTLTPLSNNGSICSYPAGNSDNGFHFEAPDAEVDRAAAQGNAHRWVELPTGVGFCMYIKRRCLDEIGYFDEVAFGRGYGEEVDFCRRALAAGWQSVLVGNVFVRHFGSVSFDLAKSDLTERSGAIISQRYPEFDKEVAGWLSRDPAFVMRQRLDIERLSRHVRNGSGRGAMLMITHGIGGGTTRHVGELAQELGREEVPVHILRLAPEGTCEVSLDIGEVVHPVNLKPYVIGKDGPLIRDLVSMLGVAHVHLHHTLGLDAPGLAKLKSLLGSLGVPFDMTLHDYYSICPRGTLIDGSGRYCGEPGPASCNLCIATNGSMVGVVSISTWRTAQLALLSGVRRVFVPSVDMGRRMRKHFGSLPYVVRPHWVAHGAPLDRVVRACSQRFALVGAVGDHKGSAVLLELARAARTHAPDVRFVVIGYTNMDDVLRSIGNIEITGAYREEELGDLLAFYDPDAVLTLSTWPETFCYTFHETVQMGVYPIAFDIGAPALKIKELGWGSVLPLDLAGEPEALLNEILAIDTSVPPPDISLLGPEDYRPFMTKYYGLEAVASARAGSAMRIR